MTTKLSTYYYNLGLALIKENQLSPAIGHLKKSVYWHPENLLAWNLLGLTYYRTGRILMARYCWLESVKNSKAIELSSSLQPDGSYYLNLLENGGNDAIANLSKVVDLAEQGEYKASLQQLNLSTSSINSVNSSSINTSSTNSTDRSSRDGLTKENCTESPQLLSYIGILEYLTKNEKQAKESWLVASKLDKSDEKPIRYLEFTKMTSWLTRKFKTIWLTINKWFGGKA